MGKKNPIKLVVQINAQTPYNGVTTSDGKIAAVNNAGVTKYEILGGARKKYKVTKTGSTEMLQTNYNDEVINFINAN